MPYCAILYCKNASHTNNLSKGGISYHRFPKNEDMKSLWVYATGRQDWVPVKSSTICSDHFKEVDFVIGNGGYKYLTDTAQPVSKSSKQNTIGANDTQTEQTTKESDEKSVKKLHAMLRWKQCKIEKQQVKIRSLQTQVRRMKKKMELMKDSCSCGVQLKILKTSKIKQPSNKAQDCIEDIKLEHVKVEAYQAYEAGTTCDDDDKDNAVEQDLDVKSEENDLEIQERISSDICSDNNGESDEDDVNLASLRKSVKKNVHEMIVPTRKGSIDYTQYEAVFDIQLFKTDEGEFLCCNTPFADEISPEKNYARAELESRRASEPYLSARYRCELCYTVYKCDKLLQFHMKWHDSTAEMECDICRMRFANNRVLLGHKIRCHRGKFTCRLCPLITYYGSAMKAHFEKHQGKTYKCHCGGVFKHISSYLTHKRKTHARTSTHVCVTCARSFVSRLGLLNHRSRTHQTRSLEGPAGAGVPCALCTLSFPSQLVCNVHLLSTHKHTQLAKDTIACRYCGLAFADGAQLRQHKREIHPTAPRDRHLEAKARNKQRIPTVHGKELAKEAAYKCDECGAEGAGRMWRLQHYRKEHPSVKYKASEDAARHMCDQCGRLFSSAYVLRDHLNGHLGLRPWACRQCGATFSSSSARSQHEVRHGPALRCPYCPARFHSSSGLCMHKRRHVGTRSHACPLCARAFLLASQLRDHVSAVHQHCRRPTTRAKRTTRA